jgi:hypothetical protein
MSTTAFDRRFFESWSAHAQRDLNAALSGMQFQNWPLKIEASGGKSLRKFGGVNAMEWPLLAQSGRPPKAFARHGRA